MHRKVLHCAAIVLGLVFGPWLGAAENIKSLGGVAKANVKSVSGVAEANIKSLGSVDNTAGGFTYDISQNFDGTGDPDGAGTVWQATGTVDWDEATIVVSGQSAQIDSSTADGSITIALTASDNVWVRGRVYFDHIHSTDAKLFRFYTGVTEIGGVEHRSTGALRTFATGGTNVAMTLTTGEDAWIYFWLRFTRGTGANATIEAWWSTTSTFPGNSNAQFYAATTNGTSTAQCDNFRLYSDNIGTTNGSTYFEDIDIAYTNPGW